MENYSRIGKDRKSIPSVVGKEQHELGINNNGMLNWNPIRVHTNILKQDFTIESGANAIVAGPFVISNNAVLTIETDSTLVVV